MALKTLMKRHKLDQLRASLTELEEKGAEFEQRNAELETAIDEASTDEETSAVEAAVDKFEAEKIEFDGEIEKLRAEIAELENEIAEDEKNQIPPAESREAKPEKKERQIFMNYETRFKDMTTEQRSAFVQREEIQNFLTRVRSYKGQTRAVNGADLTIPDEMLGLIRTEVARGSKLLRFVRVVNVSGASRQNIMGVIPEAVWTEMCAKINELEFGFNQVEVDGYKVGGFIKVCNAILEDSDVNLASEIIAMIAEAIAKALDKAILFGTGVKMPTGIATRLAQTSQPENWGVRAPEWTDLHTSNIQKLNVSSASGTQFFTFLLGALGIAKPKHSSDGLFWVMNRKTHMDIKAKALNFNAAGALIAGADTFPIIGGTIVEFEDDEVADYEIIGGFGGNYLLAQRQGATFSTTDQRYWEEDQIGFKGTARYDGMPLAGEAFVILNYANTDPTTAKEFPIDYANADMNILTVVAAAGTATGDTVLTVSNTIDTDAPVLKYKLRASIDNINVGDKPRGTWTDLTSGTTQITAAAGVQIAVIELDEAGRIVSVGSTASVPKA